MHLWVPFARHPKMHLILFFCLRLISFLPFRRSPITFAQILQPLRLRDLCLHLHNQYFQLLLTLLAGMGVDVATALFAVRSSWGIFASSAVFTELTDATGPLLSPR